MARNNHIINSFVAGMISPRAFGRTDTQQYPAACEVAKNWILHAQGGASRRTGTRFIHKILDENGVSPAQARYFRFTGSDGTQWAILITSDAPFDGGTTYRWKAIRVSDHTSKDIYVNAERYEEDWNLFERGINLTEIQYAQNGDVLVFVHPRMRSIRIQYMPGSTLESAEGTPFLLRGYPQSYQNGINPAASIAYLGGVDEDRAAEDTRSIPYDTPISDNAGAQLTLTLTTSDAIFTRAILSCPLNIAQLDKNTMSMPDSSWVGRYVKLSSGTETVIVYIYECTDEGLDAGGQIVTTFNCHILNGSVNGAGPITCGYTAGTSIEFGSWDNVRGWPSSVEFFETRAVFGFNEAYPDSQWFSETNDIFDLMERKLEQDPDFADPDEATIAFRSTLKSNVINRGRWISAGKTLVVGTNGREFVVKGADPSLTIGQTNIQTDAETPHGSAYAQPVRVDNTVAYLTKNRKTLRELVFNFQEDSFQSPNLNVLADHMASYSTQEGDLDAFKKVRGMFIQLEKVEEDSAIVWCLDNQGMLCGLTRDRQQQVLAWHYHQLAGDSFVTYLGADVAFKPKVQSICSIVSDGSDEDEYNYETEELWAVVKRGIYNSVTEQYDTVLVGERFALPWDADKIWEEGSWDCALEPKLAPVYLDCAVLFDSANAPAAGIIDGLPYGAGASVTVVLNGRYIGEYEVDANDQIDISDELHGADNWQAVVGFNYLANLVPVVPEVPAQIGSSLGQPRRVDQITIHFDRTIGCKYGRLSDQDQLLTPVDGLQEVYFKPGTDATDPYPFYRGDKRVIFPRSYESRPRILIQSHLPFPCTVTHVVARMVVYE